MLTFSDMAQTSLGVLFPGDDAFSGTPEQLLTREVRKLYLTMSINLDEMSEIEVVNCLMIFETKRLLVDGFKSQIVKDFSRGGHCL